MEYFKGNKKLGASTDGYLTTQRNKVEGLHIANSCDTIIYSDEYGKKNSKRRPIPYLKVRKFRGFQGSKCVYVGDNPHKDFVTAKKLSLLTVQIARQDESIARLHQHRARKWIAQFFPWLN
ncbi:MULTISPECIES: HAD family hydrolase [unclassified Microcoleus]|uniref:HAD family hydrolase n=1 Tax=unclassified Microcoleus TaxID=2642155 RepID=UPI0040406F5A